MKDEEKIAQWAPSTETTFAKTWVLEEKNSIQK